MPYHSTTGNIQNISLTEAVTRGVPEDNGLYMPDSLPSLPNALFRNIGEMSLPDIAYVVANSLFGNEMDSAVINRIVNKTFNFPIPLSKISPGKYSLELFHGPTLAFKDVGARFMTNMLNELLNSDICDIKNITVLAATSGDSGASVASSIAGNPNINACIFYPKGKITRLQEKQIATYGGNIQAVEVRGTFDNCQALVRGLLNDDNLRQRMWLTTANSLNIAHLLPQVIGYFQAYSRIMAIDPEKGENLVFSVPSGNLGNLTAGVIAKRMGLPIKRLIAATNSNDAFYNYMVSGNYTPRKQIDTVAVAMDVGNPYNFPRLKELYNGDYKALIKDIICYTNSDKDILTTIRHLYRSTGYLIDPHGAAAYRSMELGLKPGETGIMFASAHPAKFKSTIDAVLGQEIELPATLARFNKFRLQKVTLPPKLSAVRDFLLIP